MYMEHVTDLQRQNLLVEHEYEGISGDGGHYKSSRRKRWGSREVEICSVDLFNGRRKPCYLYKTGDKMTIEIIYKAFHPVYEPVFGSGSSEMMRPIATAPIPILRKFRFQE